MTDVLADAEPLNLSDDVLERAEQRQRLRNRVFNLLARREYTLKELHQRLSNDFATELLDEVLEQMVADGYQSDRRFCGVHLRSRMGQLYGLNRIRQDLRQKGVSEQLLREALEEEALDWHALALEARLRRFPQLDRKDRKLCAKIMRHLMGRGFSADEARYALEHDAE